MSLFLFFYSVTIDKDGLYLSYHSWQTALGPGLWFCSKSVIPEAKALVLPRPSKKVFPSLRNLSLERNGKRWSSERKTTLTRSKSNHSIGFSSDIKIAKKSTYSVKPYSTPRYFQPKSASLSHDNAAI